MTSNFQIFIVYLLISFVSLGCASNKLQTEDIVVSGSAPQQSLETKYIANLNFGLLAPLLGTWKVQDWQLQQNGEWIEQSGATWTFQAIQGGVSLEDIWVSNVSESNPTQGYGTHLRVFDRLSKEWQSAWLSSRARTLEFYTGVETAGEVIFISQPNAEGRVTRTVFSNISSDFFNWRMEWSKDSGLSWLTIYKIDATRSE